MVDYLDLHFISSCHNGFLNFTPIILSLFILDVCNSSGRSPEIFLQAPVTHIFPCHDHRTAGKNNLDCQMDPEKEEDQADEGTVSDAHTRYMEDIVTVPCSQEKEGRRHQKGSRNDACPFRDVPVWRITVKGG